MNERPIKALFLAAGVYDLAIGLAFALFFRPLYAAMQVTPPNHNAYIQLPAFLVAIFGVGFLLVYADPRGGRPIMLLGVLMKLAYAGVVLGAWLGPGIPVVYLPFAWIDLLFAAGFVWAYRKTGTGPAAPAVKA